MEKSKKKEKVSLLNRWMNGIEKIGNKLPEPTVLFIILAVIVVILSWIFNKMGVTALHPGTGETLEVINLLSKDGLRRMWSSAVSNFSGFAPLGMVLVTVIGSSVAEKSGFLIALMRRVMTGAKPVIVTFLILFVGINANLAGDAGFIIMPALAAVIYLGIGRHPLLGMFIAYAGVAAGFCANLALGMSDALAYGFTEEAAKLFDPNYMRSPAINWYFLIVSCVVLCVAGTVLVEKLLVPRFAVTENQINEWNNESEKTEGITTEQKKGLKAAALGALFLLIAIVLMCVGEDPILADPETHSIMTATSPFMSGIIITVTLFLLVPGAAFGFASGKYHKVDDMFGDIVEGFREMAGYIFMCFFIAQFTSYFNWSNLGSVIAIKGAEGLYALHIEHAIPLLIGLIIVSCIVNLFIGSASAKWAILAPVFIPMMMAMGLDPAVTQVAYRIGDSITNPISPLFPYLPIILGFARKYDKKAGVGTVIANMIPFSVTFGIVWVIQLVIWVLLGLPLGPGGNIYL